MQLVLGIKDLFEGSDGGSSDAPEMSPCRKVCALCACQGRISSNSRTRNLIIFDTINVRCGACGIIEYDFFLCLFMHTLTNLFPILFPNLKANYALFKLDSCKIDF